MNNHKLLAMLFLNKTRKLNFEILPLLNDFCILYIIYLIIYLFYYINDNTVEKYSPYTVAMKLYK